jgi:hypothetical protein
MAEANSMIATHVSSALARIVREQVQCAKIFAEAATRLMDDSPVQEQLRHSARRIYERSITVCHRLQLAGGEESDLQDDLDTLAHAIASIPSRSS